MTLLLILVAVSGWTVAVAALARRPLHVYVPKTELPPVLCPHEFIQAETVVLPNNEELIRETIRSELRNLPQTITLPRR